MANNTKQQAINTFTGGLNTDLHPLTTPNDILTDCINGTVITYNGNEYILQNDMGNYKLEKAKLWADYIPVGIKEYGNIMYIVSYNPIDKKCQIGSYPSPQTLFDSSSNDINRQYTGISIDLLEDSTVKTYLEKPENVAQNYLYTFLIKGENLQILMPEDEPNCTFLNPGDKYWLYKENNEEDIWKLQYEKYYSFTDKKEAYDISDIIQVKNIPYEDGGLMSNVTWETPGWVAYKPKLYDINYFNIYVTDISYPRYIFSSESSTLTLSLQTQIQIFGKSLEPNCYKVCAIYQLDDNSGKENNWLPLEYEEGNRKDYGNGISLIYSTLTPSQQIKFYKETKAINVRAVPYIVYENEDGQYGFIYDNFRIEYRIDLDELTNVSTINVFDTYKYLVGNNEVTINFNINSPIGKELSAEAYIYSLRQDSESKKLIKDNEHKWLVGSDLNVYGQNIVSINKDTLDVKGEVPFRLEDIYLFEVEFKKDTKDETDNTSSASFSRTQILIASSIMNGFYNKRNRFQEILASEWMPLIQENLIIKEAFLSVDKQTGAKKEGFVLTNSLAQLFSEDFNNIYDEAADALATLSNIYKTAEKNPENVYFGKIAGNTYEATGTLKVGMKNLSENNDIEDTCWEGLKFNVSSTDRTVNYDLNIESSGWKSTYAIKLDSDNKDCYSTYLWNFDIENIALNSITSDWGGYQEVKTGTRQYLFENLPWYFVGDEIAPLDSNSSPLNISKLNAYTILGKIRSVTNYTEIPLGYTLSVNGNDMDFAVSADEYRGTWVPEYEEDSIFSLDANTLLSESFTNNGTTPHTVPSIRFTSENDGKKWGLDHITSNENTWTNIHKFFDQTLGSAYGEQKKPLFIPICFGSHSTSTSSYGWSINGTDDVLSNSMWFTAGIGVLSENPITGSVIALASFTNLEFLKGFGYLYNPYPIPGGGTVKQTDGNSRYFILVGNDTPGKAWWNANIISSKLLLFGLHIYSLKNIRYESCRLLNSTISDYIMNIDKVNFSLKSFWTIKKWNYKGVDLLSDNPIKWVNNEETDKESWYDNLNFNLPYTFNGKSFNNLLPSLDNIIWIDSPEWTSKNEDENTYRNKLGELSNKLLQYSNSNNYELYSDLEDANVKLYYEVLGLAKKLKVVEQTSNNSGYNTIVYNTEFTTADMSAVAPIKAAGGTRGYGIMPTLDLSNICGIDAGGDVESGNITSEYWGTLKELCTVTQEFIDTYNLQDVENSTNS